MPQLLIGKEPQIPNQITWRPENPLTTREEHRDFPAALPLSPFSTPDLNRRGDSPALSRKGSRPPR